jgi:hypothetical protein
MTKCQATRVNWAILSDKYGVWFPEIRYKWYEKSPDSLLDWEFEKLLDNFDMELKDYDEIWFYYNPGRFYGLYRSLLTRTALKDRLTLFTHVSAIA